MATATLRFKTVLETKSFSAQIKLLESKIEQLKSDMKIGKDWLDEEQMKQANKELEVMKNRLVELKKKEEALNNGHSGFGALKEIVEGMGEGLTKAIGKVAKLTLAVFGIRAAYSGIQSIVSQVAQYDSDVADKLQSIKYTLAMSVAPLVQMIVNWAYKLVQYAQYLIEAWTGYDIFKGAKDNMSKTTKSAKELKKTLAGFDTANVLSDTSSSSAGASGSGIKGIAELSDEDVPEWLKTIGEKGQELVKTFTTSKEKMEEAKQLLKEIGTFLAAAYATIKLINLGLTETQAIGIVGILIKVVELIQGIKKWVGALSTFIKEPSWENYLNTIETGFTSLGIIGTEIGKIYTGLLDKVKKAIDEAGKAIKALPTSIASAFSTLSSKVGTVVSNIAEKFSGLKKKVKDIFSSFGQTIADNFSNAFKKVFNSLMESIEKKLNSVIKTINGFSDALSTITGKKIGKLSEAKLPRLAVGGIVNNPGHGVPIGGAIAGEAGREGVLPLTDAATMQKLGQEIGKWISVNVDLTNKLDSRVLSRNLVQINSDKSFARNGG